MVLAIPFIIYWSYDGFGIYSVWAMFLVALWLTTLPVMVWLRYPKAALLLLRSVCTEPTLAKQLYTLAVLWSLHLSGVEL